MRVAVVGGGPGGLYAAILLKRQDPSRDVTVFERNAADDTFGFGVVFSDETLGAFALADPESHAALTAALVHWSRIDVHVDRQVHRSDGHGFSALGRHRLLGLLQRRAAALGVALRFGAPAPDVEALRRDHDLVVAADGAHSPVRSALAPAFGPSLEERHCVYMWLGTDLPLDAFTFVVADTPAGVVQVHAYPYAADRSTVIVEMAADVWRAAGFADLAAPAPDGAEPVPDGAGPATDSDEASIVRCEELFADLLGGHRLRGNRSRWRRFSTVRNAAWRAGTVVLIGDAAHTAHFSIGSGTKLAMEDAIALTTALGETADVGAALAAYEAERRPAVESTQRAAQASLEWFEGIARYRRQDTRQFVFGLLTRSRRVTHDNLRVRDPAYVADVEAGFAGAVAAQVGCPVAEVAGRPPMFTPFRVGGLVLANRVVVSPMDMYSAVDGVVGDFHLAHLGARALGGAGLVMTEMVCVSAPGRITHGCGGLWNDAQAAAWRRVVDLVHGQSGAAIGLQLGHSGRKGATSLPWEGDAPLPASSTWPLVAPSAVPWSPAHQVPRAMTRVDMDLVRDEFVAAATRGAACGFDLLELHLAHGYLLSSFLTPLSNRRDDAYGGSPAGRARYPLEVLDAVRAVWPGPLAVRISATDWVPGGFTGDDAVALARMLCDHGVDLVDVSTGQTSPHARPAYGRSYQTPFSDRIRHEVGVATVTVGAISSADDVNSIVLAGRADLCALARPHLYDPAWTLHAAAEQGYTGPGAGWPVQYQAGARRPPTGKHDLTVRSRLVPLPPVNPESGELV